MKPGTISYVIAGYAALMSVCSIIFGITGSLTVGIVLALIWAAIGAGCFFFARWRRKHDTSRSP